MIFLQGIVLENTTKIACILLGRYIGGQNPAVGELMGATIGSVVGAYVDDFLAAAIGALWVRPYLKEIDPEWGIRDMFRVEFDQDLAKECLWFGIRAILPDRAARNY